MSKILLSIYLVCLSLAVHGQVDSDIYHKNSLLIALSAGGTYPIGKFAKFEIDSSEYTENIAGAALTGFNVRLNTDYFLNQDFGIAFCFQHSKINSKNPTSGELFYDPRPWSQGLGGGSKQVSYNYNTGDWKISELTTGIVAKASAEYVDFYCRVNGGLIIVVSPKTELVESKYIWQMGQPNEYYTKTSVQPSAQSYSFCGSVQADARFSLNARKKIFLLVSIEYLTSHCVLHAVRNSVYSSGSQSEYKFSFSKNVNTFGINAGIAWRI